VEPDVPVTIFTDAQSAEQWGESCLPERVSIKKLELPKFTWFDKIEGFINTPYRYTVYLDVDVIAIRPFFGELLQVLKVAPLIVRSHGIGFNFPWEVQRYSPAFPQYNTGVVVYDREKIFKALDNWKHYRDFAESQRGGNQPTFRAAVLDAEIYPAELSSHYNFMLTDTAVEPVRLVHFVTNKRTLLNPSSREEYLEFVRNLEVPCRVFDGHVLLNRKKTVPYGMFLFLLKYKIKTRGKKMFLRKAKVTLSQKDVQRITSQKL
jgi:hypothetical protein